LQLALRDAVGCRRDQLEFGDRRLADAIDLAQ
jgi:hypothetical protein